MVGWRIYYTCLAAQPYDLEPRWLISIIFMAHSRQFHTIVSRILQQANCSKSLINGQSLFIKHSLCVYFSTQDTQNVVERHSYRTRPSLSVFRNILLEKTVKPLKVKFFWHRDLKFKTVILCYLYLSQYVQLIFPKVVRCNDCSTATT